MHRRAKFWSGDRRLKHSVDTPVDLGRCHSPRARWIDPPTGIAGGSALRAHEARIALALPVLRPALARGMLVPAWLERMIWVMHVRLRRRAPHRQRSVQPCSKQHHKRRRAAHATKPRRATRKEGRFPSLEIHTRMAGSMAGGW